MKNPRDLPRYAVLDAETEYLTPREHEVVSVHSRKRDALEEAAMRGKRAEVYDLRTGRRVAPR